MCSKRLNLPVARRCGQPPDAGGGSRTSTLTLHPSFVRQCPQKHWGYKSGSAAAARSRATWVNSSSSNIKKTTTKRKREDQIKSNPMKLFFLHLQETSSGSTLTVVGTDGGLLTLSLSHKTCAPWKTNGRSHLSSTKPKKKKWVWCFFAL